MLKPVFSIEEKDFLQQLPSQMTVDQQRAVGRLFSQQDDIQIRRFLQNLHCKLQILNTEKEPGRIPRK